MQFIFKYNDNLFSKNNDRIINSLLVFVIAFQINWLTRKQS